MVLPKLIPKLIPKLLPKPKLKISDHYLVVTLNPFLQCFGSNTIDLRGPQTLTLLSLSALENLTGLSLPSDRNLQHWVADLHVHTDHLWSLHLNHPVPV